MIYWLLQEPSSGSSAILHGGVVGAVVGLVGVMIDQYLTQRRHSQSLEQTAELEAQRAHEAALDKHIISLLGANLKGANLIGANLRGADLRGAASLNQEQIDQVIRDEDTKL